MGRTGNGWLIMQAYPDAAESRSAFPDRREWLRMAICGAVSLGSRTVQAQQGQSLPQDIADLSQDPLAQPPGNGPNLPPTTPEAELTVVQQRLEQHGIGPLNTVRSAHYVGIGDAPKPFMSTLLADSEQLEVDYLSFFDGHEFQLRKPERPLIVVIFRDDRSYARYFHFTAASDIKENKKVAIPTGIYNRKNNALHVFDWRNVPTRPRPAIKTWRHWLTKEPTSSPSTQDC